MASSEHRHHEERDAADHHEYEHGSDENGRTEIAFLERAECDDERTCADRDDRAADERDANDDPLKFGIHSALDRARAELSDQLNQPPSLFVRRRVGAAERLELFVVFVPRDGEAVFGLSW